MIGKVCRRGHDAARLLHYLFTEGPAGQRGLDSEHTDAHLVAGWDDLALMQPARTTGGHPDVRRLAAPLDAPLRAVGTVRPPRSSRGSRGLRPVPGARPVKGPVYHLAISAAPTDRELSDTEWADIAAEYVHRLGLAPRGDTDAVRWVAVRHAPDHIHVVATLARQDGRRVWPRNDFYRAREASLAVEARYQLTPTSPAERTSTPETSRAEQRRHQAADRARASRGLPPAAGPPRDVLRAQVRAALAGSQDWQQFTARLRADGVLVRERLSTLTPGEITGYAVALPTPTAGPDQTGPPVWFGGGKLAPDLTLPQIQARWQQPRNGPDHRPVAAAGTGSATSRRQDWLAAQQALRDAHAQLRGAARSSTHPAAAEAAVTASGELVTAVSRLVEGPRGGPLHAAAGHYHHAARQPHRAMRPPTPLGSALRSAASLLLSHPGIQTRDQRHLLNLLAQLTSLARTLQRLRQAQQRHAQAAAAHQAVQHLTTEVARLRRVAGPSIAGSRLGSYATTGRGSPSEAPPSPPADLVRGNVAAPAAR